MGSCWSKDKDDQEKRAPLLRDALSSSHVRDYLNQDTGAGKVVVEITRSDRDTSGAGSLRSDAIAGKPAAIDGHGGAASHARVASGSTVHTSDHSSRSEHDTEKNLADDKNHGTASRQQQSQTDASSMQKMTLEHFLTKELPKISPWIKEAWDKEEADNFPYEFEEEVLDLTQHWRGYELEDADDHTALMFVQHLRQMEIPRATLPTPDFLPTKSALEKKLPTMPQLDSIISVL